MWYSSGCILIVPFLLVLEALAFHWHQSHMAPISISRNAPAIRQKRQDEEECSYNEWRCNDGYCVRINSDCDGYIDCYDSSDETFELCRNRECGPDTFRCNYGGCANKSSPCGPKTLCPDKSDELLPRCHGENIIEGEKMKCRDGQMIPKEQRCDGIVNCADGFDETVAACAELRCQSEQFQCEYGGCVDGQAQCNGTIECIDGSDEKAELCGRRVLVRPTTVAPTTAVPRCELPEQPQNGSYSVVSESNITQTDYVYLNYTCDPGFKLDGRSNVLCLEGTWPDKMPRCVQTCQLIKHLSIEYECTEDETGKPRPCNMEETEGTIVKTSCRKPNYFSPVELPYMHCHQGMWSSGPVCTAECGTLPPKSTPLVLRGVTARFGEVPWHVGIYLKNPVSKKHVQICGGSLISNAIVLSAAHCFWNENTQRVEDVRNYAVAVGKLFREWNHPDDEPFAQKSDVSEIVVPKLYRGLELYFKNDIAIVTASRPFEYKLYVVPVCLDFNEEFSNIQLRNGNRGKAAGWGLTTGMKGSESSILRVINLPYEDYESCLNLTPAASSRYITYDDKICAGTLDGEALCRGDSGGGLAFPSSISGRMRFYLRGIASTSPPTNDQTVCNTHALTSFTSIIKFEKFIKAYWYP